MSDSDVAIGFRDLVRLIASGIANQVKGLFKSKEPKKDEKKARCK